MRRRQARGVRLTPEEQDEILSRLSSGDTQFAVAQAVGCSERSVRRLLARPRQTRRSQRPRTPHRLSPLEREEISRGLIQGLSFRAIASGLGRAASTVSREVALNGGRERYRVTSAERSSKERHRRRRLTKLMSNPALRRYVETGLEKRWSPQQISAQLHRDHPDEETMRVSHETIYQSLFVQARGSLRKELTRSLRSGRARRRPQTRGSNQGRLTDMVMISERPAEVEDRAVPGHWEGDLMIGRQGKSAIATLVERKSRFVMLARLPDGRDTQSVRDAISKQMLKLPQELRKSLTWDQGKEMSSHAKFTVDTSIAVYFCDPHSPWQRGSNENTNGLLRQYFPKSTDLGHHSQNQLDAVARELNGRPRQTLEWMKPYEVFTAVASTA